jgi:microsomal dipeptidase-like Zn-dependent dipeptidase
MLGEMINLKMIVLWTTILSMGHSLAVTGIADLHTHLASHIPYGFMLTDGTPDSKPVANPDHNHTFQQQMYKDWLLKSGIKLYVNAALANVFAFKRGDAKEQILKQFAYSKKFIEKYPEHFVLATNPEQARTAIEAGKIVFVHALEGAEKLLESKEDVEFWAAQGVSMISPIHLADTDYGDASIMGGTKSVLNPWGLYRKVTGEKRTGLSEKGKKAIHWLLDAGIIVDISHMSKKSVDHTLDIAEKNQKPVIMSHGILERVTANPRSNTDKQIQRIYAMGGMIAITSGRMLLHPTVPEMAKDACAGSIDDYMIQYRELGNILDLNKEPVAWGSDFNGFVSHFRPKFGPDGCLAQKKGVHPILSHGLRTMKDLPLVFDYMKTQNVSHQPILQSAERYLQIWQRVRTKQQDVIF